MCAKDCLLHFISFQDVEGGGAADLRVPLSLPRRRKSATSPARRPFLPLVAPRRRWSHRCGRVARFGQHSTFSADYFWMVHYFGQSTIYQHHAALWLRSTRYSQFGRQIIHKDKYICMSGIFHIWDKSGPSSPNFKQVLSSLKHCDWRPHDSVQRVNAIQARCGHHSSCLSWWSSALLCQKSKWKAAKFKFRYLGRRRPSQRPPLQPSDLSASANPTQLSQVQNFAINVVMDFC